MQFLLHGAVSADALVRHEHKTHLPAELGLSVDADPVELLKAAHGKQWDIVTTSAALALKLFESPQPFGRCIVYLQVSEGEGNPSDAIDRLFARYKRLTPGRLYTVTASRVKIRQLPTARPGL